MEKEIELVHNMNRELGEIKSKLEENHEVHLENKEDIKEILVVTHDLSNKVGIQNGRVTSLEKTTETLARVESQNSGLIRDIQNKIEGTNRIVDELKKFQEDGVIRKESNRAYYFRLTFNTLLPILVTIFSTIGTLVLVRTGIINISPDIKNINQLEQQVLELQQKAKELEVNKTP